MKFALLAMVAFLAGCMTPTPPWNAVNDATEAEYQPYLAGGTGSITGQAFLTQRGGGVVKAAGRTVTLDPATSAGNEWWAKAGKIWSRHLLTPPSPGFSTTRRTTVADADGKFKFTGLATGKYYLLTEVTWEVGGAVPTQGGLVGATAEVRDNQTTEIVLSQPPH